MMFFPFNKWEPHSIAEWMLGLQLRENYTDRVIGQQIDGATLTILINTNEWESFGFITRSDVLKISTAVKFLLSKESS